MRAHPRFLLIIAALGLATPAITSAAVDRLDCSQSKGQGMNQLLQGYLAYGIASLRVADSAKAALFRTRGENCGNKIVHRMRIAQAFTDSVSFKKHYIDELKRFNQISQDPVTALPMARLFLTLQTQWESDYMTSFLSEQRELKSNQSTLTTTLLSSAITFEMIHGPALKGALPKLYGAFKASYSTPNRKILLANMLGDSILDSVLESVPPAPAEFLALAFPAGDQRLQEVEWRAHLREKIALTAQYGSGALALKTGLSKLAQSKLPAAGKAALSVAGFGAAWFAQDQVGNVISQENLAKLSNIQLRAKLIESINELRRFSINPNTRMDFILKARRVVDLVDLLFKESTSGLDQKTEIAVHPRIAKHIVRALIDLTIGTKRIGIEKNNLTVDQKSRLLIDAVIKESRRQLTVDGKPTWALRIAAQYLDSGRNLGQIIHTMDQDQSTFATHLSQKMGILGTPTAAITTLSDDPIEMILQITQLFKQVDERNQGFDDELSLYRIANWSFVQRLILFAPKFVEARP
jgi:hypothetical protein